jgi:hypothetical protein
VARPISEGLLTLVVEPYFRSNPSTGSGIAPFRMKPRKDDLGKQYQLAGAGGIEPCNNPLPHKDFSIPARPFDSIFDSKAKALVGITDDEVAYIKAKGWKASVVPELSIIHQGWLVERGSRAI